MGLKENQQNALSKFRQFVSFRNKISLVLSLVVLVCYYIFVLSVGLFPEVLGYRLGPSSVTLGIIGGLLYYCFKYCCYRDLYIPSKHLFRSRSGKYLKSTARI